MKTQTKTDLMPDMLKTLPWTPEQPYKEQAESTEGIKRQLKTHLLSETSLELI